MNKLRVLALLAGGGFAAVDSVVHIYYSIYSLTGWKEKNDRHIRIE
jgi:hypothetical protein